MFKNRKYFPKKLGTVGFKNRSEKWVCFGLLSAADEHTFGAMSVQQPDGVRGIS